MDTAPTATQEPEEPGCPGVPGPSAEPDRFSDVQASAEFGELRRAQRSFAFPLTLAFVTWYLLYVLLSNYAGDFMDTTVVGHINVAFVLGLGQFLTTFLIAWWYSRHAAAKLDPKAEALRARLEGGE
ncbi:membrane protein [Streptomyces albireticuli]|uniref:Membrane protein n=1 Tax=Streptomyces albireticuli TaxID=1940 RepID=A0A1Z2L8Y5_9ACTN|nr:membrane protein [Streptomyces albireticuli]